MSKFKKSKNKVKRKRTGFTVLDRIIANQTRAIKKQEARKQRAQLVIATADVRILKSQAKINVATAKRQERLEAKNLIESFGEAAPVQTEQTETLATI